MSTFNITRGDQTLKVSGERMPTEEEIRQMFDEVSGQGADVGVQTDEGSGLLVAPPAPDITQSTELPETEIAEPVSVAVGEEKKKAPSIKPFLLPKQLTGEYIRRKVREGLDKPSLVEEGTVGIAGTEPFVAGGIFGQPDIKLDDETKDLLAAASANAVEFLPGGEVTQTIISGLLQQPVSTVIGFGEFFVDNAVLMHDIFQDPLSPTFDPIRQQLAYDKLLHDPLYPLAAALMLKGGASRIGKKLKRQGTQQFLENVEKGKIKIPEPKEVFDPLVKQGELFKEGVSAKELPKKDIIDVKVDVQQELVGVPDPQLRKIPKPVGENPLAESAKVKFDRADKELKDLRTPTVESVKNKVLTGVVDVSGNIKRELLEKGGEVGKEAVIGHDLIAGAGARAGQIMADASTEIYSKLSKPEHKQLDRIIQTRTTISQTAAKEVKGEKLATDVSVAESKAFLESLTPAEQQKLMPLADAYFEVPRRMLKEQLDEGLISQGTFDALIGREYERRSFIEFLDPKVPEGRLGSKISNRDSGIRTLKEGSLSTLENNSQLLLADLVGRTQSRVFRNRANKALLELANTVPNNGIVEPLAIIKTTKDGKPIYQKVPHGFERIDALVGGQPKPMMMPSNLAKEWVLRDPLIAQDIANYAGWLSGAKVLKPFATGFNPEFAITNFPRDLAHIYLTTNEFSTNPLITLGQMGRELATVFPDVVLRKGRYRDYINEGGGMEFLTHQGGGGLARGTVGKLEPVRKVLGYVGETSELWTRLALRERALRNGATPAQATWVARNYLDFSQGGNYAKAIDTAVPYLNAGIQGTRGIFRAAKNNPKEFMQKVGWIGSMSTGLYLANRYTNPEAYDAIPDGQKARNFVITTPWSFKDDNGNIKHYYFAIPKDQGQRVMASTFEAIAARKIEGKIPTEQLIDAIKDFAPIIPTEFVPPTIDAIFGHIANYDFWLRQDIWKGDEVIPEEEYFPNTHPFFVDAGKITGMSPKRLEFSLSQYFTRGNIYTHLVGGGYKLLTDGMSDVEKEETQKEFLAKAPFSKKIFKVTPKDIKREEINEARIEEKTRQFKQKRELDVLVSDVFDGSGDPQRVSDFINAQPEVDKKRLQDRALNSTKLKNIPNRGFWLNLRGLPPEVRAQQFWIFLNQKQTIEEKISMIQTAYSLDGFSTERFDTKLIKLVAETESENVRQEVVRQSNK